MIHSFLLIGQSNMAGRGFLNEAPPVANDKVKVLRNGRWLKMFRPVNPDRSFSGVNLAEFFADDYSKAHPDVEVGLIPCADGGTRLDQWTVGGLLYDNAVNQARLAQRTSTIAGVLWHQGESDCADALYPLYRQKFELIMESLRKDLDLYDVPFLLGGLGDYLAEFSGPAIAGNYWRVNEQLKDVANNNPMTGFVPAEGLKSNPDFLHFSAEALMEFGHRYYQVFEQLEDKNKVFHEKAEMDGAIRSAIELL